MNPRISVISTAFKSEQFLEAFLENCLQQSSFAFTEFILHLNRATREEKDIVKKFRGQFSKKLKVSWSEQFLTIYEAWNLCLKSVTGRHIAIWNVDDQRTEYSLELQHNLLNSKIYKSACGPYRVVSKFGSKDGQLVDHASSQQRDYMRGMRHGPFFMFNREDLKTLIGFDEQFKIASDFDFCIRLASLGAVGHTEGELGYYLNAGTGASTRKNSSLPAERESIYLRYGIYDKLELSLLSQTSQFDLSRIRVLGNEVHLKSVVLDLENVRAQNTVDNSLRVWKKRITKLHRERRHTTLSFYLKHPKSFLKALKQYRAAN